MCIKIMAMIKGIKQPLLNDILSYLHLLDMSTSTGATSLWLDFGNTYPTNLKVRQHPSGAASHNSRFLTILNILFVINI